MIIVELSADEVRDAIRRAAAEKIHVYSTWLVDGYNPGIVELQTDGSSPDENLEFATVRFEPKETL